MAMRRQYSDEASDILDFFDDVEENQLDNVLIPSNSRKNLNTVNLELEVHSKDGPENEDALKHFGIGESNFERYRKPFETDDHWELRRKFMEQHSSAFPEDELVSLAQAFTNTVLLKTVYCEELTARLCLLGNEIRKEYSNFHQHRSRRFTVPASVAVNDWIRRMPESRKSANRKQLATQMLQPIIPITSIEDVFRNFILLDDDLYKSGSEFEMLNCGLFSLHTQQLERKLWEATVTVAGYQLSKSFGTNKKAKHKCIESALKLLRRMCYKIKTNPGSCWYSCNVERLESTENMDLNGNLLSKLGNGKYICKPYHSNDKLKEDNIGFQLLKKLGWGGGPLGKHKDGIVDPIEVKAKRGRRGLGLPQLTTNSPTGRSTYPNDFLTGGFDLENEVFRIDVNFYRDLMHNFRTKRLGYDLVFSSEFTEIERALLCKIAADMNLQCMTVTYDNEHYQLVLLKHRIPLHHLLVKILVEKHPIYSALYSVEPPEDDLERHKKLLELCSR